MPADLRHLRAFIVIADEGNITRAAARLRTGQPALSRTLAALEHHLGVRLVDRSTRHLELTTEGHAFRDRAVAAIAAVDAALDVRGLRPWPLRLGYSWAALGGHTVPLLRRWDEEQPGTPLELRRFDDRTAGLLSGKVDAALLRGPFEAPGLISELLRWEERVAVLPIGSPLAARDTLTLAALAERPIALNPTAGTTTLGLWPEDTRPATAVEVSNHDEWLTVVAAGRAVGVSTRATPASYLHPSLVHRPLTDAPPVPVHLVWRALDHHPSLPDLVALAHAVLAAEPDPLP
ncbi:LysR family transcriptional regulator [Streptomyces sp. NPDC058579]|uniref:LysR family transcriptional regulator n=1 Tax=Streptomyces sp. NPDC058579 TaxID=3346548 RepID=UPI003648F6E7